MKNIFILIIGIFTFTQLSGQVLECPADITVSIVDFDSNLDYGEPTVLIPQPYTLELDKNEDGVDCSAGFVKVITKEWTLSYNGNVEDCIQTIYVETDDFDDYPVPADITLMDVNAYDIDPAISGDWIPSSIGGVISANYEDQIFVVVSDTLKVLRTWNAINWCTSDIMEHIQVIKVNGHNYSGEDEVVFYNGKEVNNYSYKLLDENGVELSNGNCSNSTSILEHINCIYNSNQSINSITVDLQMPGGNNSNHLNGVSTLDLVLIQRHILGIANLGNPFLMLAADINNDQHISAIDLVEGKKLILGIYSSLPNKASWLFYNSDLTKDLKFENSELPLNKLSVVAVKTGDVNGSAVN